MNNNPIGVFDSGVGGVSVLTRIRALIPDESIVYIADSACAPYGNKPQAFLEQRCIDLTRFLIDRSAKAIVVACNTATAAAVARMRSLFSLPVIAMEPAIKPATQLTQTGVVGILATKGTINSEKYSLLINRFEDSCRFISQPCPGLVEQIETGELHSDATRQLLKRFIDPLITQGADTLVLGCTHFPLVNELIQTIAGPGISIIDGNQAVAAEVQRRLAGNQLLATDYGRCQEEFWTSGEIDHTGQVIARLWHPDAIVRPLPIPAPALAC